MNEEYYRCVGYCVIDADSGRCGSCGRPAEPVSSKATANAFSASRKDMNIANGEYNEFNRFPTDPGF